MGRGVVLGGAWMGAGFVAWGGGEGWECAHFSVGAGRKRSGERVQPAGIMGCSMETAGTLYRRDLYGWRQRWGVQSGGTCSGSCWPWAVPGLGRSCWEVSGSVSIAMLSSCVGVWRWGLEADLRGAGRGGCVKGRLGACAAGAVGGRLHSA